MGNSIAAAITIDADFIQGDVPIIVARDEDEREKLARHVANILRGTVHDLGNGTYLIVQH